MVMDESSSNYITLFSVAGKPSSAIGADTVTVTVPFGTDVSSLVPTIIISAGASIYPSEEVEQNFNGPVTYTVTAEDGTPRTYTVNVSVAESSAKEITSFTILGIVGHIDTDTDQISLILPYGTSRDLLTPTIGYTGITVNPESDSPHSFDSPVTYTVTAADLTTKDYTVTVKVAANPLITAFTIPHQLGFTVIDDVNSIITVTMPYLTDLTSLVPTVSTNEGATVSPLSGAVANFGNGSVTYIASQDDSIKLYSVNVATSRAGSLATFSASGVSFNMRYVPGGLTFPQGYLDQGTATVASAYWIAETSVTYQLWSTVYSWATAPSRGANIYTFANSGLLGSAGTGDVTQPVTNISWRDAIVFTNALTEWYNAINYTNYTCVYLSTDHTTPIRTSTNVSPGNPVAPVGDQDNPYINPDATGFRMLSSMEWELAARYKGSDNNNGAIEYPVGSDYWWTPNSYASGATEYAYRFGGGGRNSNEAATEAVAWYRGISPAVIPTGTQDVGLLTSNALGLFDMSGNVWQWSFDWLGNTATRTLRGGAWNSGAGSILVSTSGSADPYGVHNTAGFRLARTDNN